MIRHFTASAIILAHGHVLLICHRKGGGWIYPGGHLEAGEDPAQTVLREVREELGISIELITDHRFAHPRVHAVPLPFTILDVAVRDNEIGPHRHIDAVYAARPLSTDIVSALDEVAEYRWVPIDKAGSLRVPDELPTLIAAATDYAAARPSPSSSRLRVEQVADALPGSAHQLRP
jgi:8-oxo-dGTP pyrophosphatase MutT (NUDIX family)